MWITKTETKLHVENLCTTLRAILFSITRDCKDGGDATLLTLIFPDCNSETAEKHLMSQV